MNKIKTIISLLILISTSKASYAMSFEDALSMAYENNPFLKASREELKATDENMPQAISGFLPSISANTERGRRETTQSGTAIDKVTDTKEIVIRQPLFRGGQTYNNIKLAKNIIESGRESLKEVEQEVLLEAITAYSDIIRDQEVLELRRIMLRYFKNTLR